MYILRYNLKDGSKQQHLFDSEYGMKEFYKTSQQYPHRTNYEGFVIDLDGVSIKTVKI